MKVQQFIGLASDFAKQKPWESNAVILPEGYDNRIKTTWFGGTMIITHPEKPPIYLGKDNKFHELKADRHA